MNIAILLFFFFLGLIFGSFFNVVGLRLPKNQPFANNRSICPHCRHPLAWYELIPVLSYIIQQGKCRHCKWKISIIYPAIELATGGLFVLSYVTIGFNLELITALLLISMLVIIFVSDLKYMLIPNKVLLFFLPLFIVMRIYQPLVPWWSSIAGALVGFFLIAMVILVSRGGMGAGDMKLFGVLGIVLGVQKVLLTLFLSCLLGTIISVILLLFKLIERKQAVAFGPYIAAAALGAYFYGDGIIDWYINALS